MEFLRGTTQLKDTGDGHGLGIIASDHGSCSCREIHIVVLR